MEFHLYEKSYHKSNFLRQASEKFNLNVKIFQKDIFKEKKIKVKTFFAPNHTFDKNTIKACRELGINSIIDGYGIAPYYEDGMLFFPQLFYRLYVMPFGFQVIQIHLNYFTEKDFSKLEQFVKKNQKKIITFSEANHMTSNRCHHPNVARSTTSLIAIHNLFSTAATETTANLV